MKRLTSLIITILTIGMGWNATAISPGKFHIGLEGSYCIVNDGDNKFGLLGANAAYTMGIGSFFLNPEVSLYYQHYPENPSGGLDFTTPPLMKSNDSSNTFGGGIGCYIGRKIISPVYFFTGPLARCNFYQKDRFTINGETYTSSFNEHRANLLWRFGIGADISRVRIRISYDLYVTDRYQFEDKKDGAITIGLSYSL